MQFLRDGFWKKSTYAPATPKGIGAVSVSVPKMPSLDSLEVVFATDGTIYDGRYIDNAWLQEAPDPVTKVTWDNVAVVSPKTAKDMGVYNRILKLEPDGKIYGLLKVKKNAAEAPGGEGRDHTNPVVKLRVNGREIEVPVLVGFGHADDVISISLGYGQGYNKYNDWGIAPKDEKNVSIVGVNRGFNAYALRTSGTPYLATGAKTEVTQKRHQRRLPDPARRREKTGHGLPHAAQYLPLQAQRDADMARLRQGKQTPLRRAPAVGDDHRPEQLHRLQRLPDRLHNIPVVGKEQVAMGREMHWIRMDRYFAAKPVYDLEGKPVTEDDGHGHMVQKYDEDNPEMIPQPVACMQCESAPCETVCPVNATVHSEDGLNTMAYNRCIGTRYCANNCPYKARRFNFFDYNKRNPLIHKNLYKGASGKTAVGEATHLQRNPNVTVRMRGVMEKCTYCVQRLQAAKGKVKAELKKKATMAGGSSADVKITDAELRPKVDSVRVACQDACPAGGITFGNLQDGDKATVVRSRNSARNYELLHYIGTLPRTTYLARVKNPNPEMPDAKGVGRATINMH